MMITKKVTISGITCEACIKLITKRISKLPGVSEVSVKQNGETEILSESPVESADIMAALQGTNYTIV